MIRFMQGQRIIEVFVDAAFSPNSMDNPRKYNKEYQLDEGAYIPFSKHAVRVLSDDDIEIESCILFTSGGATGVHEHSGLVHDDSLILAVGPFIVSLSLPTLVLNWKTQSDFATCFGIYHSEKHHCYISHGELEVARVSYTGEIDWSQSGADIFTNGFLVTDDIIKAIDFCNDEYAWNIEDGLPIK
jgi:hypothetical protein